MSRTLQILHVMFTWCQVKLTSNFSLISSLTHRSHQNMYHFSKSLDNLNKISCYFWSLILVMLREHTFYNIFLILYFSIYSVLVNLQCAPENNRYSMRVLKNIVYIWMVNSVQSFYVCTNYLSSRSVSWNWDIEISNSWCEFFCFSCTFISSYLFFPCGYILGI